jgi:hypothetical protein
VLGKSYAGAFVARDTNNSEAPSKHEPAYGSRKFDLMFVQIRTCYYQNGNRQTVSHDAPLANSMFDNVSDRGPNFLIRSEAALSQVCLDRINSLS